MRGGLCGKSASLGLPSELALDKPSSEACRPDTESWQKELSDKGQALKKCSIILADTTPFDFHLSININTIVKDAKAYTTNLASTLKKSHMLY